MRIKNWAKHQHYKDRNPPWIKLYKEILDDPDWHELSGDDAKSLIMLWLIASESKDGELPAIKKLSFRLRINESQANQLLARLSNWLEHDASNVLAKDYQDAIPETETETETETEKRQRHSTPSDDELFEKFWFEYPKKTGKGAALKSWQKMPDRATTFSLILQALSWQKQQSDWTKDGGQFIPNPATYLNQKRWLDEKREESIPMLTKNGEKAKAVLDQWLINQKRARGEI